MLEKPKRLPANSLVSCKIDGCDKKAVAFHLCSTHYSKLKKYGDPNLGRTNSGGICKFDGCERKVEGFGFCRLHYERFKRHSDPSISKAIKIEKICYVDECNDVAKKLGLCLFHYGRLRQHGDPLLGGKRRFSPNSQGGKCEILNCIKKSASLNLCTAHFSKLKKYGDPLGGSYIQDGRSKEWNIRDNGYVQKFDRKNPYSNKISGIVFQHREVMGEAIGRPLRSDENVHHKNGNKSDNRIENLELWVTNQPPGQRIQDQVQWARFILQEYGDLIDKLL